MFQIDLQKAYDMVHWGALEKINEELGFPAKFVNWVMTFVTSVTYTFNVNGEYSKYLQ